MNKLPWMKFFPSDYMHDTRTLTLEEKGCWMDLICHMWLGDHQGTLKIGYTELARLWGLGSWELAKDMIWRFNNKGICDVEDVHQDGDLFHVNADVMVVSRRMKRESKSMEMNSLRVKRYRVKRSRNANVMDEKLRSQKTEDIKDKGLQPAVVPARPPSVSMSDVQKVVTIFKLCQGVDQDDKGWDKVFFPRYARPAKDLIALLGSWRAAGDCIQDVYERLTQKGLTVTLETVIKHATEWRRDNAEKQGGKHGVFSLPGDGSR